MDKLKMHSKDKTQENYEILQKLFPNAVTETIVDGEVVRAIDKDVLQQEINAAVVEGKDERYQFTWPDKKRAIISANAPINKTLRPCREESVDFDNTENLYIEGDNLEVLKLLQETYLGKIKMIYIDPPYNTGKDFVYSDKYSISPDEWDEMSGELDEYGNRLTQNNESNGRFHTDWLNMIYPCLKIARDLLTDDGVIFISIDNNEVGSLSKICDEIFSEKNCIGQIVLQTATDNNPCQINTEHEYMLCYSKNKTLLSVWASPSEKAERISEKYLQLKKEYGNDTQSIQKELRIWIKKYRNDLQGVTHYDNVDERGVFHDGDIANTVFGGYKYDIIHPLTGKPCKIPEKGFRFPKETMFEMIQNGDIMFGKDETTLIKPKKRLENAKDVLRSIIYEDGRASTKQFEQLMSRDIFQNPKSPTVLERLIGFVVQPDDIVMDFFSGSGTTAESVYRLNANRKLHIKNIMVQLPENLDETLLLSDSRTKKTIKNAIRFLDSINKPHTICEIGKERIRRAGTKIKSETGTEIDYGFRVLKLDSSNMKDVYYNPANFQKSLLDTTIDNIKEERTPEDLLFQVMLDLGVLLSEKIEESEIAGKKVFNVANGYLIACFDSDVNEETITAVAKQQPIYFVMRDSSLSSDTTATNFDQIFETYSPDTIRKVI